MLQNNENSTLLGLSAPRHYRPHKSFDKISQKTLPETHTIFDVILHSAVSISFWCSTLLICRRNSSKPKLRRTGTQGNAKQMNKHIKKDKRNRREKSFYPSTMWEKSSNQLFQKQDNFNQCWVGGHLDVTLICKKPWLIQNIFTMHAQHTSKAWSVMSSFFISTICQLFLHSLSKFYACNFCTLHKSGFSCRPHPPPPILYNLISTANVRDHFRLLTPDTFVYWAQLCGREFCCCNHVCHKCWRAQAVSKWLNSSLKRSAV